MQKTSIPPAIVVDCKNSRIRIHRQTLHLLGDPDYIQLMVNPELGTLAISPSERIKTAHAVRWEKLSGRKCCELYSKPLVHQLKSINPGWTLDGKYHMTGNYLPAERLICFRMASQEKGTADHEQH